MKEKFLQILTEKMMVYFKYCIIVFVEIKDLKTKIESLESKIKRMHEERKGSQVAVSSALASLYFMVASLIGSQILFESKRSYLKNSRTFLSPYCVNLMPESWLYWI